jgi:hypothetical protein
VLELWDGIKKNWQASTTHTNLHKTNTRWLVHSWNIFGAKTSHGQLGLTRFTMDRTWEKPPPSPYNILCASPRGPHPNGILSWDSQVKVPKLPKLGFSRLWGPITLHEDFRLRWSLKQSCSSCWEFSSSMLHTTCTQGNQVNSWLLVVENQTAHSTPGPSFSHNLCCKFQMGHASPF